MKTTALFTLLAATAVQIGCAQAIMPAYDPAPPPIAHASYPVVHAAPRPVAAAGTHVLQGIGHVVALTVKDRASGHTLPIYLHRGEYWVAGTPGQAYAIGLSNHLNRRTLATTSVDGINVVSGETAGTLQRGYVLSAHARYDVAGWRKSEREIAAFHFAAPQASYAAQTGRPANVGVIGVAVFTERQTLPPPPVAYSPPVAEPMPYDRSGKALGTANPPAAAEASKAAPARDATADSAAAPAKRAMPSAAASAPAPAPGLGTQHGQRESSYAPTVAFIRESQTPAELITLRYDTVDNLVTRGVLRWAYPELPQGARPAPFPQSGFVPDPPPVR